MLGAFSFHIFIFYLHFSFFFRVMLCVLYPFIFLFWVMLSILLRFLSSASFLFNLLSLSIFLFTCCDHFFRSHLLFSVYFHSLFFCPLLFISFLLSSNYFPFSFYFHSFVHFYNHTEHNILFLKLLKFKECSS